MKNAPALLRYLLACADPAQAAVLRGFFKTGKGEYGEGDEFLGLRVPQTRALVKRFWKETDWKDLETLFASRWHEARLAAALVLVEKFERAEEEKTRGEVFRFYVKHLPRCNNWDLIDLSVYKILGAYLYEKKDSRWFDRLARSENLWEQRAAVVGTMYWVKRGKFGPTLSLAEFFLMHKHDLMHKACGWLLREVGKKDEKVLCLFLDRFYRQMPRTMLRYALEKLNPQKRKFYMNRK